MTKQSMMPPVLALTVALCATLAFATGPVFADDDPEHNRQNTCKRLLQQADLELSPFLWSALAPPILPVEGSDDLIHLVYELTITSLVPVPARIETVEVIDPTRDNLVLDVTIGDEMASRLVPLQVGAGLPPATLGPSETQALLLDVTVETREDVPEVLLHRVTVALDLGAGPVEVTGSGGCAAVSRRPALVLSPPLRGDGWANGNGCCIDDGHRAETLASNGTLHISQRFATDFFRFDAEDRIFFGDPTNATRWVGYGAEVVAAAPGEVVTVVDGFPDEVPLQPRDIPFTDAFGNHVIIDMGRGRFAMYAHLAPRSIVVQPGERVRRGQRLGLLGNSGQTFPGPHLHFHVTDGPSAFNSSGVPYVFGRWTFQGRLADGLANVDFETGIVEVDLTGSGDKRRKELPLQFDVMGFRKPR